MPGRRKFTSLAQKYSVFTASLVFWVVLTIIGYDLKRDAFDFYRGAILCGVVVMVAAAISRFTNRLLAKPLTLLEAGIQSVGKGRLEPIRVSRTGDEIEFLGESFNAMIHVLAASRQEVKEHQEMLEERIRQRTEALEEAVQRALAASKTKSEFLANMSHELRTPMTGVLGMLDIVLDSSLRPDQREQLETAQRCANTLLALLNDILDLSKIEAGRMSLERIAFDLRELVEDCLRSHLQRAKQKGISLELSVAPDVPRRIVGDPLRLRQIVANLVSNGVKFTDKGSIRLTLTSTAAPVGGCTEIQLEVRDTGIGINAEKLATIFDEFTQADGSISRKYGGTGLGLTITRRLVEMHGGRMSVESEPGLGSAFLLTLPYEEALEPKNTPEIAADPIEPLRAAAAGGGAKAILVVEDNHVNQRVVTAMLKKKGHLTVVVNNGQEALDALEKADYSMVLMDIQMPVLDGLEATRRIRRNPRWSHLPIIAMTAHAMTGDRDRCLAAGMNSYISKPVNSAHLLATIDQYIAQGLPSQPVEFWTGDDDQAPPIDQQMAERLMDMDTSLMQGMLLLFLQLAQERLQKLRISCGRGDAKAVLRDAEKIRRGAERIAAVSVARWAGRLEEVAKGEKLSASPVSLLMLERAVEQLHQHAQPSSAGSSESRSTSIGCLSNAVQYGDEVGVACPDISDRQA